VIVPQRHCDELCGVPALATLPALCACIDAFVTALDLTHPRLRAQRPPRDECEHTAMLLYMHLEACQGLLSTYDDLTFAGFDDDLEEDGTPAEPDDDIPF
jgi:hypothetical protein